MQTSFRLILMLLIGLAMPINALAISARDLHAIRYDTVFYDENAGFTQCGDAISSSPTTSDPTQAQVDNAKTIIGIAKTENLGKPGALIGLMVGLDESGLLNYANSNIPLSLDNPSKQATGSDHLSLGVFQQQVTKNWTTLLPDTITNPAVINQLMTPAYSAEAFFGSPPGTNAPSALSKGLQNVANWQNLTPQKAAQAVQASASGDGSNYLRKLSPAQDLLNKYYDSSSPVALPVPLTVSASTLQPPRNFCSSAPTGAISGCTNPITDSRWSPARTDMGVDYTENASIPVLAICDGIILATAGPGWPGGIFILIKMTSGPFTGKCTYVAEHLTNVLPVGTKVTAGQQIATTIPGYPWTEWGWASGPQTPSTPYNGSTDGTAMPGGKAFARFLRHLGAVTRDDPGPGPEYDGNSCP